jgi:hypothetical protein
MFKKTTALVAVAACLSSAVALAATTFTDVPADHWAKESIDWANSTGVMTGPADQKGMFDPAGAVNRAQLATVSARLYKKVMADVAAEMKKDMVEVKEEVMTEEKTEVKEGEEVMTEVEVTWAVAKDGMFYGMEGKMYRYMDGMVEMSADGKTWTKVEGNKWMATDGYWYMFDEKKALMMSKDEGKTWTAAESFPGKDASVYMVDEKGVLMMGTVVK